MEGRTSLSRKRKIIPSPLLGCFPSGPSPFLIKNNFRMVTNVGVYLINMKEEKVSLWREHRLLWVESQAHTQCKQQLYPRMDLRQRCGQLLLGRRNVSLSLQLEVLSGLLIMRAGNSWWSSIFFCSCSQKFFWSTWPGILSLTSFSGF